MQGRKDAVHQKAAAFQLSLESGSSRVAASSSPLACAIWLQPHCGPEAAPKLPAGVLDEAAPGAWALEGGFRDTCTGSGHHISVLCSTCTGMH